ncbi:hypothetical protein [Deinococcus radiodurans]|uniref:hypothetical protein n=1 Tax=Deinococcus radiodurans TaxID=1299 RepID=UPI000AB7E692|nr:hypothetical protein [Deinococcus radiodurans]
MSSLARLEFPIKFSCRLTLLRCGPVPLRPATLRNDDSVDATWEQVKEALSSDDYAVAFDTLEQAMREAAPPVRGELALRLAHLHSLYGDPAQPDVRRALNQAYAAAPALRSAPLARALEAELTARAQGEVTLAPELAADPDPLVRYHALCALALAGRPQEALDVALPAAELPEHLRWRLRSWQADAQEALARVPRRRSLRRGRAPRRRA